jgi:hypothetical protein
MLGALLLLVGSVLSGFASYAILKQATTSIHEIQGLLLGIASVIEFTGCLIVSEVALARRRILKELRALREDSRRATALHSTPDRVNALQNIR